MKLTVQPLRICTCGRTLLDPTSVRCQSCAQVRRQQQRREAAGLPEDPVRAGHCHEGSNITPVPPETIAKQARVERWKQAEAAASVLAAPVEQPEANKRSVEARTIAEYFSEWKGRTERPHVECRDYALCCARCEFRPVGSFEKHCHKCVGR